MKRISHSLLLMTFLLPMQLLAQNDNNVLELSLEDAMSLAVRNNYQAKNARLDIDNQRAINAEVTGRAYPNISGKGEFNAYPNPVKTFIPASFMGGPAGTFTAVQFTPTYSATGSLTASQILFDGSVMVALQARNTLLKLYKQSSKLTEQEVRYNINVAYNSLVVAQKQFDILKESIAYAREMSEDMTVMYDNGFIERIELDRTRVNVNNLTSDSLKIGNALTVNEQMLKYLIGIPNHQEIVLVDTSLSEQFSDATALLMEEVDYMDRMDFRVLQTQLDLNKYDLKRHKLSGLPQLSVFGNLAITNSANDFTPITQLDKYLSYSLVGAQLNVPLFDGLQRRNRVKQAKIAVMKTQNQIDNLKLGIDFQKNQSRTTLKNALLTMNNQKRNLDLARNVLRLAKAKYDAGVGSNTEVSLAQTDLLTAQNNYFQSLLDVVNAQADLKKALGEY